MSRNSGNDRSLLECLFTQPEEGFGRRARHYELHLGITAHTRKATPATGWDKQERSEARTSTAPMPGQSRVEVAHTMLGERVGECKGSKGIRCKHGEGFTLEIELEQEAVKDFKRQTGELAP
ncbi:hypothetical protein VTL71DRAFT_13385 [Oculimacula yallundae]|uniref:Uncharacterized protein n=1 Tax=Oculimacula yallundae TaxID=86028 RepID=A0ABR4CK51_9HELO